MKNLDLNAYGVVELTQQEMIAVEGGSFLGNLFIKFGELLVSIGGMINNSCEKVLHL